MKVFAVFARLNVGD